MDQHCIFMQLESIILQIFPVLTNTQGVSLKVCRKFLLVFTVTIQSNSVEHEVSVRVSILRERNLQKDGV